MLTPHAGELARLLGIDSEQVERARLRTCALRPRASRAIVVLKGDDTLVVEPDGRVAVSRGNSPALATAGTGDVLTGTLAALLAQGMDAVCRSRRRRPAACARQAARLRAGKERPRA